ncbi:hypothetical protein ACFQAT_06050 [Undibacterium arcticum]|uniref:Uncharacterized protein n=1 Tax=Undibacterium arcticum TaxID=1762892 RepID=A0ABV7F2Q2_9BURK
MRSGTAHQRTKQALQVPELEGLLKLDDGGIHIQNLHGLRKFRT